MNSRNELLKKVFDKLNENDIGAASSILDTIFSNEAQLTYFSNWNLDFA
tara:strand:+ start:266 stop:412 length:147 start_codon:yes stop_codon:yes gene_type:complete